MKVLQIIDTLNVGGAEVLAVNIANSLPKYEVESYFCTTRKEGALKDKIKKEVNYIFLKRKRTLDFKAILKLKKYIKTNKINIVHAHTTSFFFAFCLQIFTKKTSFFWHNHTGSYASLKGFKFLLIRFISSSFDRIINVNDDLNNWSIKKLKHKKSYKLNNFPEFIDQSKSTTLFGKENKRIVCLAALRNEKDHINLLEAFKTISLKCSEWTLHLVGKDYNNAYSDEIKTYIKKNDLSKTVFLYDMCSDIKNILLQSTIGVLQSKYEGLPISILEYGLAKLPVIVTNVGECGKVIEQNKSGIIVEKEDSLQLAKALEKLIVSKEKRKSFGELHYKNVKKDYSKESFINQLIKLYQELDSKSNK